MSMDSIMLDLETMGSGPTAAIVAIGAVAFDPEDGELGAPFYAVVNLENAVLNGGVMDASTVLWWLQQSDAARAPFMQSDQSKTFGLHDVLLQFGRWLSECTTCADGEAKVWGNGSDFDNVILASAYRAVGLPVPWKFYHSRCYRTLKSLLPETKLLRTGTHHNALDDAVTQANHLLLIWEKLGLRKEG